MRIILLRKLDKDVYERFALRINYEMNQESNLDQMPTEANENKKVRSQISAKKHSAQIVPNKNSKKILAAIGALSIVSLTFLAYKLFSMFTKDSQSQKHA